MVKGPGVAPMKPLPVMSDDQSLRAGVFAKNYLPDRWGNLDPGGQARQEGASVFEMVLAVLGLLIGSDLERLQRRAS